jgi:hypothetical protein
MPEVHSNDNFHPVDHFIIRKQVVGQDIHTDTIVSGNTRGYHFNSQPAVVNNFGSMDVEVIAVSKCGKQSHHENPFLICDAVME